ncbi:MAG: biopolymer transporter ExbD [Phycisphaerae bacterium]|jgi:biopolymer transport protein ExbD
MSRYRDKMQRPSGWNFNMTPLIDVTFLLLTYFMLASHFSSAEKPDMKLPSPDASQAVARHQEDKVIINMMYQGPDAGPALSFGPVAVETLDALAERLTRLAEHNPRVELTLRADRRVRYGDVRRVMEMAAAANLGNLKLVAETDSGR